MSKGCVLLPLYLVLTACFVPVSIFGNSCKTCDKLIHVALRCTGEGGGGGYSTSSMFEVSANFILSLL